jgi:hypothetical protein
MKVVKSDDTFVCLINSRDSRLFISILPLILDDMGSRFSECSDSIE